MCINFGGKVEQEERKTEESLVVTEQNVCILQCRDKNITIL